ncbi:hypothetical protein RA272_30510, partial [Pseudomonas syringae pv. tagetis]
LTQVEEIGYGEKGERPHRSTHFERDPIGRLLARHNNDARQDFTYDDSERLLSQKPETRVDGIEFGYNDACNPVNIEKSR